MEAQDEIDLDLLYDRLINPARDRGILVVNRLPTTMVQWYWVGEPGGELEYVDIASHLSVGAIYSERKVFSASKDSAAELYQADFVDLEEEEVDYDLLLRRLEKSMSEWKKYDETISEIRLHFVASGITHEFQEEAFQYTEFKNELRSQIGLLENYAVERAAKARTKAHAQLQEKAETLARDNRFAQAKNKSQRRILAENMYPAMDMGQLRVVMATADAYFQEHVFPEIEEQLTDRANQLMVEGNNQATIAVKLGISREKLQRLLLKREELG